MDKPELTPYATLFHRRDDFVATFIEDKPEWQQVRVKYWKWLPYDQPDNAISGMDGWYRYEAMLPYIVSPDHSIFRQYGLPPEYRVPFKQQLRKLVTEYGETVLNNAMGQVARGHRFTDEPEMQAILDFVPDPDRHNADTVATLTERYAVQYAQAVCNLEYAQSEGVPSAEELTQLKALQNGALDVLVTYTLSLIKKDQK